MIENTVVLSMNAPFDFYFVSVFCFCQLYSMLIGLIKWSCTVQASELPVRASQLIAFDAGHAGLSFLPQSPRMICHPRVRLCGHPQTHKNMLAASSVGLRLAATRPACNLRSKQGATGPDSHVRMVRVQRQMATYDRPCREKMTRR